MNRFRKTGTYIKRDLAFGEENAFFPLSTEIVPADNDYGDYGEEQDYEGGEAEVVDLEAE